LGDKNTSNLFHIPSNQILITVTIFLSLACLSARYVPSLQYFHIKLNHALSHAMSNPRIAPLIAIRYISRILSE
jgi:hypothetical protein